MQGGPRCHALHPHPPWPCYEVLQPNFQSVISQTNNGCSLLSLIFAKLLLLNISCKNIFALFVVTALTACTFSIKKCAKTSVFYMKTAKSFAAGGVALIFPVVSPLTKFRVRHCIRQMRSAPAVNRTRHEGSVSCTRYRLAR